MLTDNSLDQTTAHLATFGAESAQHHETLSRVLQQYNALVDDYRRLKSDFEEERESREKYKQLARGQERKPFILVLVDGDGYVFNDDLLSKGAEGGSRAAQLLDEAVKRSLRNLGLEHCPIVVRIYSNLAGLSRTLSKMKLCGADKRSLAPFVANLNRSSDLFDFVDAGEVRDGVVSKVRAQLRLHADSSQCRHIFFAGCHEAGYVKELTMSGGNRDRITLVRSHTVHPEFDRLGLRYEDFPNLFRSTPTDEAGIYPPAPRTKPAAPPSWTDGGSRTASVKAAAAPSWDDSGARKADAAATGPPAWDDSGTWTAPTESNSAPSWDDSGTWNASTKAVAASSWDDSGWSTSPKPTIASSLDSGSTVCPFFQKGYCRYGKYCRQAHVRGATNGNTTAAANGGYRSDVPDWRQGSASSHASTHYPGPKRTERSNDWVPGSDEPLQNQIDFAILLPEVDDIPPNQIPINKDHHRLDPYLPPANRDDSAAFAARTAEKKLCNSHHLRGHCAFAADACEYDHRPIGPGIRAVLQSINRNYPCPKRGDCRSLQCVNGHICQRAECRHRGGKLPCKFGPGAHAQDLHVADMVLGDHPPRAAPGPMDEDDTPASAGAPGSTSLSPSPSPSAGDDARAGGGGEGDWAGEDERPPREEALLDASHEDLSLRHTGDDGPGW